MRTDERRMRKRPMRIRYTNRGKCLLCYLISFAIPLLWQLAALRFIFPYKLAATAPEVPESFRLFAAPEGAGLPQLLSVREDNWLALVCLCALAAWALVLVMQLLWRMTRRVSTGLRATQRAIHSYRLMMLLIWALSFAAAAALWQLGVHRIEGRTIWDLFTYFVFYLLLPFSAAVVSRLAAPSALSGRHAFFKRL